MGPKNVVVTGYATLDYVVQLHHRFEKDGTVAATLGPSGAWPRAGAAVLYAGRRIAAAGHICNIVSWIAPDSDGDHFLEACDAAGISTSGIDRSCLSRTSRCILAYQPDGSFGCFLDLAAETPARLTDVQRKLLRHADVVCIAIGPEGVTREIVEACPEQATVAWIAKLDDSSQPQSLRCKIAARADIIFCNSSERAVVDDARANSQRSNQVIIETRGSGGLMIEAGDIHLIPAAPVDTTDATGAGDTLAGEMLAQISSGYASYEDAARLGIVAARALLLDRRQEQDHHTRTKQDRCDNSGTPGAKS